MRFAASKSFAALVLPTFFVAGAVQVKAAEFVSEQYGFHVDIPAGFVNYPNDESIVLPDGTPMNVAVFAEDVDDETAYPIAIYLQRLGQEADPGERFDLEAMPGQGDIKYSVETIPWRELTLQVLRSEQSTEDGVRYLRLVVQIPLKDDSAQIGVGGPLDRAEDVSDVFASVVKGFVPDKTYVVKTEPYAAPTNETHALSFLIDGVILLVLVGVFILIAVKFKKSAANRGQGGTS